MGSLSEAIVGRNLEPVLQGWVKGSTKKEAVAQRPPHVTLLGYSMS